jgi:hypothetical protein
MFSHQEFSKLDNLKIKDIKIDSKDLNFIETIIF